MRKFLVLAAVAAAFVAPSAARAAVPVVYVQNDSTVLTNAQVDVELPAFQIAVSRDLARYWGTDALITDDPAAASSADMVVYVKDDSDILGAIGYHEVGPDGRPTSYVFADTANADSVAWQLVFTHELFEMLVDPWTSRAQLGQRRWWLVEVGDPVETTRFTYHINGVQISDFILPTWYTAAQGPYDFTRGLKRPGQIAAGGYAVYWSNGRWTPVFNRTSLGWTDGR